MHLSSVFYIDAK